MNRNEILNELFRVQATLDHVVEVGRAGKVEIQFLRQAQARQLRAIKAIAVLELETKNREGQTRLG